MALTSGHSPGESVRDQDGYQVVRIDGTIDTEATLNEPISVDDNGGSLTVDGTVALSAGSSSIGGVTVRPDAATTGLDTFRSIDVDETEEEVKATAGKVYGYYAANLAASARFLKFYDATVANVVVGTTTPKLTIPLGASAAANVFSEIGVTFSTAITVAATTGVADNDTGAPGANEVVVNLFYK